MAEVVVMVGVQGCGKSTYVARHLAGSHVVISKDHWPSARHREARQRRAILEVAREHGAHVRAVYVDVPLPTCLARNDAREGRARVPVVGILAARKRLVPPTPAEGFERVDTYEQS